jgi:hypothetical protein
MTGFLENEGHLLARGIAENREDTFSSMLVSSVWTPWPLVRGTRHPFGPKIHGGIARSKAEEKN